jgi:abortive infection bacteriophage resistance protein
MHYAKPAYTIDQQLQLLIDHKLQVGDETCAKRYLSNIGFTRLFPYRIPFIDPLSLAKDYKPGTTFQDIVDLYHFDRKLRFLASEALDRIEISIRTVISNVMSTRCDPHWFNNPNNFTVKFQTQKHGFAKLINDIERCTGKYDNDKRDPLCRDYYAKYSTPDLPPSWIVAEVLPMGSWSKIYSNITKTKYKKEIASHYSFHNNDFGSWLHGLTVIRNICAHHSRFWNRHLPPKATNVEKYVHKGINLSTTYCNLVLIYAFLRSFTRRSRWNERLFNLVEKCPLDVCIHMGFPATWIEEPFWNF